ncbi:MAG: hypothetical protein LBL75_01745 [Rickettsiales bacterium]|jgi:hypothetical protein|nr:hypothetical protein [Rickettsiales bacterium]
MKIRIAFIALFACICFAPAVADPIAGYGNNVQTATSGRSSPRASQNSRSVSKAATQTPTRNVSTRATASRGSAQSQTQSSRAVSQRSNASRTTNQSRAVRARTGVSPNATAARVSVGSGSLRASVSSSAGLSSALYTGTYSNIVDPTTGLISADAYSNCMSSYYACMDEICTARNASQRRCACAGRVKTFSNVEAQLQTAKEDLLKVSGQLSLLVLSKGESVADAMSLTDAEKVMNCMSWRDAVAVGSQTAKNEWCSSHTLLAGTTECDNYTSTPAFVNQYCASDDFVLGGSNWMNVLNGTDSDILANLETYASAIDKVNVITTDNNNNLYSSFMNVGQIVGQLDGTGNIFADATTTSADTLASMWGYDLFAYAHNNVCNRVLNSCFNGIYETCSNNKPYNYNDKISVSGDGGDISVTNPSNSSTANAVCFGYTSTSGDPYSNLRTPVADARRSVIQKYALDANADCDVYGEALKTQATNMAYSKIAATQALQQKRLEFAQEKAQNISDAATAALTDFNTCISEVWDCYNTQEKSNPSWTTTRVKTYCAQTLNVPSCYKAMVCNSGNGIKKVIDVLDSDDCDNSQDASQNTCRNVVTLNEILRGVSGGDAGRDPSFDPSVSKSSTAIRENCLWDMGVEELRNWQTGQ